MQHRGPILELTHRTVSLWPTITYIMVSWCLDLCDITVCFPFNRAVLETSPTVFESPPSPSQGFMGGGWEVESRRVTAYQDGRSREGGRVLRVGLGEPVLQRQRWCGLR